MTRPLRATRLKHHTPQSYSDVVLADSPLAFYRCEDAFGAATLADSSGNGRNATLNGTRGLQAYSKNPRLGRCVGFFVGSGYASVASAAWHQILGDLTVECWIRLQSALGSGDIQPLPSSLAAGETEAANACYRINYENSGGTTRFNLLHENGAGVDNNVTINATIPIRVLTHVVITRNTTAKTYSAYINGALVGTSAAYTTNPTGGTTAVLNINRNPSDSSFGPDKSAWDGIAIYGTALSAARIFEHYRAGRRAPGQHWENTELLCLFDGADAATTCPELSELGRPLTFNGNAQLDTADKLYGTAALLLDGTGDYVTIPNTADLSVATSAGDKTIEAWFKISATGKVHTITGKRDGSGAEEHTFQIDSTEHLIFSGFNSSAVISLTSTSTITTGTWHHAAATRIGTTWYLHLDGVMEASGVQSGTPATNTGVFYIGRDAFNTSRDFQGAIDSVRITAPGRYTSANFTPGEFLPYE